MMIVYNSFGYCSVHIHNGSVLWSTDMDHTDMKREDYNCIYFMLMSYL